MPQKTQEGEVDGGVCAPIRLQDIIYLLFAGICTGFYFLTSN